ncbi:hypothetical protein ACJJJB_00135 (plasmid) [Microbulbifer sp. ANSA001]|uniref:hypothetical protein n=1 Tax=Microbulbifer sp. ANSA001 TaxID=3243358 RepID=UPI0040433C4B
MANKTAWLDVPKIPRPPQCEAMRETVYYRDTEDTDRRCVRAARVLIGGQRLCMQHAGPIAIGRLVSMEAGPNEKMG